jgi:hypothetical protein
LIKPVRESGFAFPDRLFITSWAAPSCTPRHGPDDLDLYGVYLKPPEMIRGLELRPHFVESHAPFAVAV